MQKERHAHATTRERKEQAHRGGAGKQTISGSKQGKEKRDDENRDQYECGLKERKVAVAGERRWSTMMQAERKNELGKTARSRKKRKEYEEKTTQSYQGDDKREEGTGHVISLTR